MKYFLSGEINSHQIKARHFRSRKEAEKILNEILFNNNLQVEWNRRVDHTEEFVCDNYTRFFVGRL